ncbi:MAG: tRNA (5-methylaminomethyl-2-thiouridine)(34)-methyltransferase MnmD [Planctomycetota bacterium]
MTDDGTRTLRDLTTGDTFHSESGALAESLKVFIENGELEELLSSRQEVQVFETGFGTGLNFFLAASTALLTQSGSLFYDAVEPYPISTEAWRSLEYSKIEHCQPGYRQFADSMDLYSARDLKIVSDLVELKLFHRDLESHFRSISNRQDSYDLVFHDPFSPESVPELWEVATFQKLFKILKPGGRLLTYCVKSKVQKTLLEAGFEIRKTKGPAGGKREVLIAIKPFKNAEASSL